MPLVAANQRVCVPNEVRWHHVQRKGEIDDDFQISKLKSIALVNMRPLQQVT